MGVCGCKCVSEVCLNVNDASFCKSEHGLAAYSVDLDAELVSLLDPIVKHDMSHKMFVKICCNKLC